MFLFYEEPLVSFTEPLEIVTDTDIEITTDDGQIITTG